MADIIENGKGQYMDIVPYNAEMGSYNIDKESLNKLKSKSLMEQIDCYKVKATSRFISYSYGEVDSESEVTREKSFWNTDTIENIIVDDGVIVGVVAKKFLYGLYHLFPGETINTYSASEDDGTGSFDRDDYISIEIK